MQFAVLFSAYGSQSFNILRKGCKKKIKKKSDVNKNKASFLTKNLKICFRLKVKNNHISLKNINDIKNNIVLVN